MIKPADIILIVFFAIISFCSLFFILNTNETGDMVVVTVDREPFETIPLSSDGVYELTDGGFHNTIEISDGEVKVISANCPDKLCTKTMAASLSGQTIICLPNKVVVEVQKEIDDNEIDSIAN